MQPKLWTRFRWCLARKRAEENLPAPPLPTSDPSTESGSVNSGATHPRYTYPALVTYRSLDEAVSARQKRVESKGVWPQPAVKRAWLARQQQQNEAPNSS